MNRIQLQFDWRLWVAVIGLGTVGSFFIYSATSVSTLGDPVAWYDERYLRQVAAYLVGGLCALAVCFIEYHVIARWSVVLYWISMVLLWVVFLFHPVYGAQRWIPLGTFKFQPTELAKISLICLLAHFLSRPHDELRIPRVFIQALGMMLLPFVVILLEPDLGSALVLLPVGFGMMFVAGVPWQFLLRLGGAVFLVVILVLVDVLFAPRHWQVFQLEDYQKNRLKVYFGLDFAPADATPREKARARFEERKYSYNVEQALIAVGSGGLAGKGWRQGTQNALGYLPRKVAHNDFIFSVIAEEKGFIGSMTVLALYGLFLFGGLRIASQARDRLGQIMAVGVIMLWFSHVFINIGMNIRMMPVTGIPLPLLSDGGSSVLCFLLTAGLLQNIYLYRRNY